MIYHNFNSLTDQRPYMKFNITENDDFKAIIRHSRAKDLHELTRRLFNGAVIVYGEAGIGKTALLEMFRNENPGAYYKINFLNGYQIGMDESLLVPFLIPSPRKMVTAFPELLIIDDFDEIRSPALREKVAEIIREGWRMGHRVILSARRHPNEKVFERYASSFKLGGLDEKDIDALVDIYDRHSNEHPDLILTVRGMVQSEDGNPRNILTQLNYLLEDEQEFSYHNSVVIEELERPTIILEEAPKIITDLRFVNKRVLDRIGRRPAEVRNLSSRQFEELVAELFEERGYKVELTKQTRDGGKDLIILDHREIGNFLIYTECKHYAPHNPVGVSVISDLVGRMTADRATAGMVVTSSYFSPDAKVFQSKFEHQMKLIDFIKLSSMIERND